MTSYALTLWHTPANHIRPEEWELYISNNWTGTGVFIPLNDTQVQILKDAKVTEHHEPPADQRPQSEWDKYKQAEETAYHYLKNKREEGLPSPASPRTGGKINF